MSDAPFGVGRVTIPLAVGGAASDTPILLTEKNGRVFYYAETERPVRAALRELLNKELQIQVRPQSTSVYFLFTGNEPLDLTIYAPDATARQIVPVADAASPITQRAPRNGGAEYSNDAERINRSDEYPHVADVYLTGMLAHRLGLQLPSFRQSLGAEIARRRKNLRPVAWHREIAIGRRSRDDDDAVAARSGRSAVAGSNHAPRRWRMCRSCLADVVIEPLASHVPEEWLYIRYGSFVNYQWFRKTLDTWGGDMRNLITLRGLDYNINARVERQLSLHESPLAPLLGPAVMSDVALVGDDPFMREGAAIGMLFQARSSFAMANDFGNQRAETLQREKDAPPSKKFKSAATKFHSSRRPTTAFARFTPSMAISISSPPRGGWSSGFTKRALARGASLKRPISVSPARSASRMQAISCSSISRRRFFGQLTVARSIKSK